MNRKFLTLFGCIALFAALCFSCSRDGFIQTPIQEGARGIASLDSLEIPHVGGTLTVVFNTDVDWVLETPDWLDVGGITEGNAGSTKFTVTAKPNLNDAALVDSLKFYDKQTNEVVKYLKVSQENVVFKVVFPEDVEDNTLKFNWDARKETREDKEQKGTVTIKLSSNVDWKIVERQPHKDSLKFFSFSKMTCS